MASVISRSGYQNPSFSSQSSWINPIHRFPSAIRSYAQVVKDRSSIRFRGPLLQSSNKLWIESKDRKDFCFRCGDNNNYASQCRDPIRCFSCGKFGHKRIHVHPNPTFWFLLIHW